LVVYFLFKLKRNFLLIGDNKKSSQPIQLLKNLQKIVPDNILDVLQTGVNETKGLLN